jgi:putative DNA primase/helicase
LPVVFDEAEGNDMKDTERMERVLSLVRAASADDGGVLAKGSSGGTAKTFKIRACFSFASIGVQVKHQSDRGRVTILGLLKNPNRDEAREQFEKLEKMHLATMTPDYIDRLQARTVKHLPAILANARTFSKAAATELGEQRLGDQLGALLAGVHSLYSSKILTYDEARDWIQDRDWSEERSLEARRDELDLFQKLMEALVRVESEKVYERNIGELILVAFGKKEDAYILMQDAEERLKRLGFRIDPGSDRIVISNTSEWIKRELRGTKWAENHNTSLLRIEGAKRVESTRFGSGVSSRAVSVPLKLLGL